MLQVVQYRALHSRQNGKGLRRDASATEGNTEKIAVRLPIIRNKTVEFLPP